MFPLALHEPTMPDTSSPKLTSARDDELGAYRPVSRLAIVGVIVGLLSPLALVDLNLLLFPLVGVVVCAWALIRIARSGTPLLGRKAAWLGLVVAVLCGTAALADFYVYRWLVRREARQFAEAWFGFLAHGEPHKAHQLTLPPAERWPLDENLWTFYREGPKWQEKLDDYIAPAKPGEPPRLVHTLLELDDRAEVRYRETIYEQPLGEMLRVGQVYAVTHDDDGQKKTFFVAVDLERRRLPDGRWNWRLTATKAVSGGESAD
jgi:hypothetical protein